jgi:HSP20 family molecular chaperone IbpA
MFEWPRLLKCLLSLHSTTIVKNQAISTQPNVTQSRQQIQFNLYQHSITARIMSYWPGYYPGEVYFPDPWQTTLVSKHFPEHHYPLEHTRHAIGRALGDFAHDLTHTWIYDQAMIRPRSDIRESKSTFYLDVELPGVAEEEQLKLKWLGSRTLLLRATVTRAATPEDGVSTKQSQEDAPETTKSGTTEDTKKAEKAGAKPDEGVYLTLGERQIGTLGRAFNFPVDVDHDSVTAKLYAGVLRLTVPKVTGGSQVEKHVAVQTGEAQNAPSNEIRAAA